MRRMILALALLSAAPACTTVPADTLALRLTAVTQMAERALLLAQVLRPLLPARVVDDVDAVVPIVERALAAAKATQDATAAEAALREAEHATRVLTELTATTPAEGV